MTSAGSPIRNSRVVAGVTKPAPPSTTSDIANVANAVGWCTPRCWSRVHPRSVVQITGRIRPSPVEPPSTPLKTPTPASPARPKLFVSGNFGRGQIVDAERDQEDADGGPDVG